MQYLVTILVLILLLTLYIDDVICALLHAFEQRKSLIEQITKKNCDQHVYSKKRDKCKRVGILRVGQDGRGLIAGPPHNTL